jgi:hypothetical protein
MALKICFARTALLALAAACLSAQGPAPVLTLAAPPDKLTLARSGDAVQTLKLRILPGYHANSNKPNDDYLIPMKLTWDAGAAVAASVEYPKPTLEKSEFSDQPLSVYTGEFAIRTRFQRAASAMPGPGYLTGKLRYQACNDKMCLPPRTLEVKVPLLVE